ncbi:hypothetical protein [Prochlorococcus sp. MIT 0604]|uniref:hypothetical protein n=1 Tax=Prochlorococcus sp. MIT 0604 TaxID=1501268 RepID=UPI0004F8FBD1|nr:hypothetical protein [Prochlorococcus sp. MIT 0604]AIQ96013.1 hypothetical protein EW14_2006 [Prochlorococcus sp. MIT 0604]
MNRLFFLILPFPILLLSCGAGSFYEANLSCEEWLEQGGFYVAILEGIKKNDKNMNLPEYVFDDVKNNFSIRKCIYDKETNQILGLEVSNREKNKTYYFPENQRVKDSPLRLFDLDLKWKIEKRFKY